MGKLSSKKGRPDRGGGPAIHLHVCGVTLSRFSWSLQLLVSFHGLYEWILVIGKVHANKLLLNLPSGHSVRKTKQEALPSSVAISNLF